MDADETPIYLKKRIANFIKIAVFITIATNIVNYQISDGPYKKNMVRDFDAFYVYGTMAASGRAAETYSYKYGAVAQYEYFKETIFMPWTYPPPFTLFVSILALLPPWVAYGLFVTLTTLFYVWVIKRLAGPYAVAVIIAILPTFVLEIMSGQNGFLTGGLVGLFALYWLERRPSAGIPLGLMVIKPHLAVGIALLPFLERRWRVVLVAAAVSVGALAISTVAFGFSIWPAFIGGVREAGAFLSTGAYPLHRMTSLYAVLHTFSVPHPIAYTLQALGALGAIGMLLYLWRQKIPSRLLLAAACCTSLLISPYNYDYDLTILGVAIALLIPSLLAITTRYEQIFLCLLCWFVTGYGFIDIGFSAVATESMPLSALLENLAMGGKLRTSALYAGIYLISILLAAWVLWLYKKRGMDRSLDMHILPNT